MAIPPTILTPIELYQAGELEMNCANMVLSQDDAKAPTLYRGPGYIRQDDDGQIRFKLFATQAENPPSIAQIGQLGTPGKLLSADRYYTLAATDALGRRWVAEKIIPDGEYGADGLISVGGNIHTLSSSGELDYATYSHSLYFFEEFDYLPTREYRIYKFQGGLIELLDATDDVENVCSGDFAFSIRKGDGVVTLGLMAARPFPAHIETRVIEALQFILARTLWCRAIRSIIGSEETIKLVSPRPASARTRLPPPISLWSVAGYQHLWQLFDFYLRYVLRKGDPGWHSCTVHLHAAREASANSIEAYALGLAVAVEGITNALFPQYAEIDQDYSAAIKDFFSYIDALFDELADKSQSPYKSTIMRLYQRVSGFRGQLLQPRAVDRMYQLAREGMVDERHIAAWKKLRNTSAHAGAPGVPADQKIIDLISCTVMMMYHMIFLAIGYQGRYIDYSTHGHPPRAYPSREFAPDQR